MEFGTETYPEIKAFFILTNFKFMQVQKAGHVQGCECVREMGLENKTSTLFSLTF